MKGFNTTPIVGRREMVKPIEMATYGIPWTKFVVPAINLIKVCLPSMGSTIHVGESSRMLSWPPEYVSSPMNQQSA